MNSRVHEDPALEPVVLFFFLIKVKHRIKCEERLRRICIVLHCVSVLL